MARAITHQDTFDAVTGRGRLQNSAGRDRLAEVGGGHPCHRRADRVEVQQVACDDFGAQSFQAL